MEQKPSLEDILRSEEVTPQKGPVKRKAAPAEDQNKKKGKKGRKRTVLWIVLAILALLLVGGGIWAYRVLVRPETMFTSSTATVTEAPQKERVESAFDLSSFLPTAAPEEQAPATAEAQAATPVPERKMDNIVNVMLMGIDAFEGGGTTSGSQPHTDVMMVVAVNFDKDTVDLITLPRDTFTTAPGYHGFYKLNGVFNAGGGMDDLAGGFALTCRAAEIWLGGITIPYYYAVDFQAVVDIVDAIGGIDYQVDQTFKANVPQNSSMKEGKTYYKSDELQHLDGNAVLGYLRIRHDADGLDSSRTARQRRMMVAIFTKLKKEGKLSQIPSLINAATSGVYTNTTLEQTTALVNYAISKIGPENIRTRAMYGDIWYQHYFKYCFVDQQNRIDLIKEVYGIDAEPVGVNTPAFENWLYDIGFLAMKYVRQPEKVFKVIEEQKAAGKQFTDEQIAAYAACYQAYTALDEAFAQCSKRVQKAYVDTTLTEAQIEAMEKEVRTQLKALNETVHDTTMALAKACDVHTKLEWKVGERWFVDGDINEKFVAFG
ncbi:MAG: LCP family protein [Clostridia bacterium]|nr:LCP family protein [Clostridia bacterium]